MPAGSDSALYAEAFDAPTGVRVGRVLRVTLQ